jgi:glycine oxidase
MATQCRPTLKNNLPEIKTRKDKGLADVMAINGLYRHGYMISPAVLDCALELLASGESNTALELGLSITQEASNQEASVCV